MMRCAAGWVLPPVDRAALTWQQLHDIAGAVLPYAAPVWKVLNEKRKAGQTHSVRRCSGRPVGY